jgi:hypothetical protein
MPCLRYDSIEHLEAGQLSLPHSKDGSGVHFSATDTTRICPLGSKFSEGIVPISTQASSPAIQPNRGGGITRRAESPAWRTLPVLLAWLVGGVLLGTGSATAQADQASAATETLPAGTKIYLRLETPVSTTKSHLRGEIQARVVRDVPAPSAAEKVVIPLGALAKGIIEKLIPTSSPTDRARVRLQFTRLELPDGTELKLTGHLAEVENAREAILADGTIRGLLESELPLTHLETALERLKKSSPQLGGEIQKASEQKIGKGDTSIDLPVGVDLHWVLDEPLETDRVFPLTVSNGLSAGVLGTLGGLLAEAPQRASSKDGKPGDPLNLVLVGSADEVRTAFEAAGWAEAAKLSEKSAWETLRAVIANRGYKEAPVSQLYLYNRPEDLAFQKMYNTFAERHHLRLWRAPVSTPDGREIWLGAATHDTGWDIRPGEGVVSHAIDPELDDERDKVGADLAVTGNVAALTLATRPNPLSEGLTATGATWKTDGRLLAAEMKPH